MGEAMKDNEKIYDDQISPLMTQIIEICKEHGIPMVCEFQYSDTNFCKSLNLTDDTHPMIRHMTAISECAQDKGVNIDKYMMWVMKGARKTGHTSIILQQLGIPVGDGPKNAGTEVCAITVTRKP
jgi:hypothetical protein